MKKLFDNLIVSCPNGGGLFLIHQRQVHRLESRDVTGVDATGGAALLGFQPSSIAALGSLRNGALGAQRLDDIHDILLTTDRCYMVGTTGNEVLKLTHDGLELKRWIFSNAPDSWHINCLADWNNSVVFSAFGEFENTRGYKGTSKERGFVQSLDGETRLISGLSQPHSLTPDGDSIILANSELREVRQYDGDGRMIRAAQFDGYTRGISISKDVIYVGLSASRNVEDHGIKAATIVALDRSSWKEIDRLALPAAEIYTIKEVVDTHALLALTAEITDKAIARLSLSNSEKIASIGQLEREIGEITDQRARELLLKNQQVNELSGRCEELHKETNRQKRELDSIYQSRSWKITAPIRLARRLCWGLPGKMARLNGRAASLSVLPSAVVPALRFYGGSPIWACRRVWGVLMREGLRGIHRRARILTGGLQGGRSDEVSDIALYGEIEPPNPDHRPLVSIIVPNYNHAPYLRQRLGSIYAQTYRNFQVILLDDCSNDNSKEILQEFAERYAENTICHFNEVNSGGVFNQWKKGLELATGQLIWIAESDDYCSDNFLEELVRCFQKDGVRLAFATTQFVSGTSPEPVWTLAEYLHDLGLGDWKQPFIKSANKLVQSGWIVKNLVPNVSSTLFRHPGALPLFNDPDWLNLRICGDWVFYLSIVRGGLVAYNPAATNFYRQHVNNTSVEAQKRDVYYREHETVAKFAMRLYAIGPDDLRRQRELLYNHWCSLRGNHQEAGFTLLYNPTRVLPIGEKRLPNVLMAAYALAAGGGETFPIMLANVLQQRGYGITLLNCSQQPTELGVRNMVSSGVPVVEVNNMDLLAALCADLGAEIIHSHHAWVDVNFATFLMANDRTRHVITTHGMYEMMEASQLNQLLPLLERRVDAFVYTAEKNLQAFPPEFQNKKAFRKIKNSLPPKVSVPISRRALGIDDTDFALCLVSRAIAEKGWEEAISAVIAANERSSRAIHLLMIGEGPEYERLNEHCDNPNVHFLGFRSNIRDYFAACDIGFLPSRFRGESAPLVLIDCLLSGKPMLATNIGEISHMLSTADGVAGALIELKDWKLDIPVLTDTILSLANDVTLYQTLVERVPHAAAAFDISVTAEAYESVYKSVLSQVNEKH